MKPTDEQLEAVARERMSAETSPRPWRWRERPDRREEGFCLEDANGNVVLFACHCCQGEKPKTASGDADLIIRSVNYHALNG